MNTVVSPDLLPIHRPRSFPKTLQEAIWSYEETLRQPQLSLRKTIWQTWRDPVLSEAMESKWTQVLAENPSFDRDVVTDLFAVFPKVFQDNYFDRTAAKLVPGAAKADVWRYATLYHYGGVYVDADSMVVGSSLEHLFRSMQQEAAPILSNEGHWWKGQYVPRCKRIWDASNLTLPEMYDRSVLQWALVFPYPHHPILWQALQLVDQLIAAAPQWEETASLGDKVLCATGPAVFTVAVHMVLELHPQTAIHWEGIDYKGKMLFKDPAAPRDDLHYQTDQYSSHRLIHGNPP